MEEGYILKKNEKKMNYVVNCLHASLLLSLPSFLVLHLLLVFLLLLLLLLLLPVVVVGVVFLGFLLIIFPPPPLFLLVRKFQASLPRL